MPNMVAFPHITSYMPNMAAFLHVASYMPNMAAFLQKTGRKARGKESLKICGNSIENQVGCVDIGLNKTAVKMSQ